MLLLLRNSLGPVFRHSFAVQQVWIHALYGSLGYGVISCGATVDILLFVALVQADKMISPISCILVALAVVSIQNKVKTTLYMLC